MNDQAVRQENLKAVLNYLYQDNTKSGSHCRYNLKYHIVWIPKYRRSILVGEIATRLKQILIKIAHNYNFKIIALEVMPDHVHLLVESPPKYAPSRIVGILKGVSSKQIRHEFLDIIKQHIWKENTLWARGYYIASVADGVTADMVEEYIKHQKTSTDNPDESNDPPFTQLSLFNRK